MEPFTYIIEYKLTAVKWFEDKQIHGFLRPSKKNQIKRSETDYTEQQIAYTIFQEFYYLARKLIINYFSQGF